MEYIKANFEILFENNGKCPIYNILVAYCEKYLCWFYKEKNELLKNGILLGEKLTEHLSIKQFCHDLFKSFQVSEKHQMA